VGDVILTLGVDFEVGDSRLAVLHQAAEAGAIVGTFRGLYQRAVGRMRPAIERDGGDRRDPAGLERVAQGSDQPRPPPYLSRAGRWSCPLSRRNLPPAGAATEIDAVDSCRSGGLRVR
jgi:hypothetical protein